MGKLSFISVRERKKKSLPDPPRSPFQDLGDRAAMGLSRERDEGTDPPVDTKPAEHIGRRDKKIRFEEVNPGMTKGPLK